ncbi:hypothetical protein AB0B89_08905 [Sphaerisporangium sp. NPDC049002]|uniref:hypothetical protein n=1 Tax=unclassified Sphaerisporangium TaxID=2630420 RepID=UPI003410431D
MADTEPTCELHLRMAGQAHDQMLRLHGARPTEDDVAAWMQEGAVIRLQVTETANRAPHTMLVNFGSVVFAWLCPYKSSGGVSL